MEKGVIRWRGRLAGGFTYLGERFERVVVFRRHEDRKEDGVRFDVRNKFCRIGGMIE